MGDQNVNQGGSYSSSTGLSKNWETIISHTGIYTGGKAELYEFNDEIRMACILQNDIAIVLSKSGTLIRTLQQDIEDEETKESFVTFAIRPKKKQLVTAGRNLLLRLWNLETYEGLRTIKAHETPVLAMTFDPTGTLLATGGSDRTVKVFDIDKGYCTHNFKGHSGIIPLVQFHPDPKRLQLISCSDDTTIRVWDLYSQSCISVIQEHMSIATCVAFSNDGYTMLSGGRDKVVQIWDLRRNVLKKTVLVHEAIEGLHVIPPTFTDQRKSKKKKQLETNTISDITFVTAGELGTLRKWCYTPSTDSCVNVFTQETESTGLKYVDLLMNPMEKELIAISSEHNFHVFSQSLERKRQLIGYNDDILSIKFIPKSNNPDIPTTTNSRIVFATNSEQIRVMDQQTLSTELLSGHTDIVMAVSVSPDGRWLASASKDQTAKLWDLQHNTMIASCPGHTEALSAVAMSQHIGAYPQGSAFFVTGSSDKTLKLWSLMTLKQFYRQKNISSCNTNLSLSTRGTVKAHEKDINSVSISPNDRFVASASQDKLIKVWTVGNGNASPLSLAGVCRGHKRGVWAVEFSPVDQCLASSSGDKTVKVWSAKDFTCLKTFEGHTASVLNVQFVCFGMQLISAGADGLLKLWTIKSNECEATLDNHSDKIWALSVSKNTGEIVSGGSDSTINIWRDITEQEEEKAALARDEKILLEQKLLTYLRGNKLEAAVELAFELGHPHRLLQILYELLEGPKSVDGPATEYASPESIFINILNSLSAEKFQTFISWLVDWNTNAKHSGLCHIIISTMLQTFDSLKWKEVPNLGKKLDALIAYSERHFERLDRLLQKSYLVDFNVRAMKNLLPESEMLVSIAKNSQQLKVDTSDHSTSSSSDDEIENEYAVQTKNRTRKMSIEQTSELRKTKKIRA